MTIKIFDGCLPCEGRCGRRIDDDGEPVILWHRGRFHLGCIVRVLQARMTTYRISDGRTREASA